MRCRCASERRSRPRRAAVPQPHSGRHGPAAHLRLGRRRQIDADRPAALGRRRRSRGSARRDRARFAKPRRQRREDRFQPAARRAPGRARAGHHHRHRLALFRDPATAASSSSTRPATSNIRATWRPAPRMPTSPSCWSTPVTAPKRQTRRHAAICDLVGIKKVVLAVNKMDLVDFAERRYHEIESEFRAMAGSFRLHRDRHRTRSRDSGPRRTRPSPSC